MFNSKKGDMNILLILFIIMVFSLILILGIIFGYILYVAGHDYAVLTLYDIGVQSNSSAEIQAGFENTVESYEAIDVSGLSDDIWFFSFMFMVFTGFIASYKSRNTNLFSFLSILTYGILFILYIFSFFLIIMEWLYYDILLNLFINTVPNLPKLELFVSNSGIIILILACLMLLVKVIDFDFSSWTNRRKADGAVFDDEVV